MCLSKPEEQIIQLELHDSVLLERKVSLPSPQILEKMCVRGTIKEKIKLENNIVNLKNTSKCKENHENSLKLPQGN